MLALRKALSFCEVRDMPCLAPLMAPAGMQQPRQYFTFPVRPEQGMLATPLA